MKAKYIRSQKEDFLVKDNEMSDLTPGKIYDVKKAKNDFFYNVIDDSGEEYLYPKSFFEVIGEN